MHTRVLSGAFGIGPILNQPDHSVLIHSHVDGKVFDIADRDVVGSDVSGSCMGTLYFDGSRLTSFADDSWSTCEEHSGMQQDGEHRYQVMHV